MSEISVGPEAAQQLDAQQANEADTHHGEAGAEANPLPRGRKAICRPGGQATARCRLMNLMI